MSAFAAVAVATGAAVTRYRAAEPQAVRTISALEESASEFRLLDV